MTPEEMMHDVHTRLRSAFDDSSTPKRPTVRVRMVARLGENVIDIDQEVPLGDGTPETIEHVQALACDPFNALLTRLIEYHFRGQSYRLNELQEEPAP